MMAGQYIMSVTAAALFTAVITSLVEKKGTVGATLKFTAGLFLTLTMVAPFAKVRLANLGDYFQSFQISGSEIAASGVLTANQELSAIIKNKTQSYILDKATSYGAQLTVQVYVEGEDIPVPVAVEIRGNISPYARAQMQKLIEEELGIALEEQRWSA